MFGHSHKDKPYFAPSVIVGHIAHAFGGFGVALLLQQYLKGNAFLPVWASALMLVFSVANHIRSWMNKTI